MILAGREEIERYVNLGEIHLNPALRGLSGILDVVFKVGVACVPAVHRGPGGLTPSESQYNRSKASGVAATLTLGLVAGKLDGLIASIN